MVARYSGGHGIRGPVFGGFTVLDNHTPLHLVIE